MKIKLAYEMQKRFEDHSKLLKKATKTSYVDSVKLTLVAMDMLHLLADNVEDESDKLQLEGSFEVLLKLTISEVEK